MLSMKPRRSVNHYHYLTAIILGLLALVISVFLDRFILDAFSLIRNNVLDTFFFWVSDFGMLFVILFIMTTLFLWETKKKEWIVPLWLSFFSALVISFLLKLIVARMRPLGEQFIFGIPDYSFPSSHVAVAFAVIPLLDKEFPSLKWFWISLAGLVLVSRLYLQVHYLSDVIAGAVIGYAIGWGLLHLREQHYFFRSA